MAAVRGVVGGPRHCQPASGRRRQRGGGRDCATSLRCAVGGWTGAALGEMRVCRSRQSSEAVRQLSRRRRLSVILQDSRHCRHSPRPYSPVTRLRSFFLSRQVRSLSS